MTIAPSVGWHDTAKEAFLSRFASPTTTKPPVTLRDLKIVDEEGRLVPLILNPVQRRLMEELELDPDDPAPVLARRRWRKRILKARREGITTLIMALFFLDTYNNAHRRTVHVSDDEKNTKSIFEIVSRFHLTLPAEKRRPAPRANPGELYLSDIDSSFRCGTAGTKNLFSGSTLNNCHKSERAKWPGTASDIAKIDASLDEACRLGNIIEETTAQGFNWFKTAWDDAERGEDTYQAIFFAWFERPDYRAPVPKDFERTPEEEQRSAAFGLDDAQLQWYREKRKERKNLVMQEYPHTAQEAFISTGNPYFNREVLVGMSRTLLLPGYAPLLWTGRGALKLPHDMETVRRLVADPRQDTYFRVWEMPQAGKRYIIGADTAQGITNSKDPDYCTADVLDCQACEQVASLHGRWEPYVFALLLFELGWWYAHHTREIDAPALLIVERENHGHAVNGFLQHDADMKYPLQVGNACSGLYIHDPANLSGRKVNRSAQGYNKQVGWPSGSAKSDADATLAKYISDAAEVGAGIWLNDRDTVSECLTYVHLPGGAAGGEAGSHDDKVRSIALCCAGHALCYERPIAGAEHRAEPGHYQGPGYGSARREPRW